MTSVHGPSNMPSQQHCEARHAPGAADISGVSGRARTLLSLKAPGGKFSRLRACLLFHLGVCLLPAFAADLPREIALDQAIQCALEQNRDLQMARLSAKQSDISLEEAGNEFKVDIIPLVSGNSAADSSDVSSGLSLRRKTALGTEIDLGGKSTLYRTDGQPDLYRDTVSIGLQQPLLRSAGLLVNSEPLTMARSRQAAARRELELLKTDVVMRVAETYEELLRLQMEQALQERTVGRLERLVKLAKARERQGRATRVDTIRSEIRLGDARLLLSRIQVALQSARDNFDELLGLPPATELTVLSCPIPSVTVTNSDVAVQAALSNRLDYAQILQDHEDALRGVRIARKNLLPDLNLALNYQRLGEDASASAAGQLDEDTWFVGLQAKSDLPLRSEINGVRSASVGVDMAQVRIDTFRDALVKQVMRALADCEYSKSEVSTADKNYRLAQRQAEFARKMFERGKGDGFAASDAEDELQSAQTKWLTARTSAAVTAYRLLRVTGTLLEGPADLKPRAGSVEE